VLLCAVLVFTIGKFQSGAGLKIENASICLKKDSIELAKSVIKNKLLKDQKSIIQENTFGLIQMAHNAPLTVSGLAKWLNLKLNWNTKLKN
jgi:hypothetical protein